MTKLEIIELFKIKGILGKKNNRIFNWKTKWDNGCEIIWEEFVKQYRTDDEAWFCLSHNIEPYICEVCGNIAKFTGNLKSKIIGYNTTCENCSANSSSQKINKFKKTISLRTDIERHNINEKRKQTNKIKYGDENYNLFGSISFKDNLLNKYGNINYNNREKSKQTCLRKYGVEHNFQLFNSSIKSKEIWENKGEEIRKKIKETCLTRYGVDSSNKTKEKQNKISNTKMKHVLEIENTYNCTQQAKLFKKYGQGWKTLKLEKLIINGRKFISNDDIPLIIKYVNEGSHTNKYYSNKEKELLEYIKTIYNGEILSNVTNKIKTYSNKYYELDIFLPELNIAFDFNGNYWHSNIYKDKFYHHRKTLASYNQGIQLINIYEYDWDNNKLEIQQKIKDFLNNLSYGLEIGWIPLTDFNKYKLSNPIEVNFDNYSIFTEGKFIKI